MKCWSGLLALCILSPVFSWIHRCPPTENLAPLCVCEGENHSYVEVVCKRLDDAISDQLSALKNYKVDILVIENSGPLDMIGDLFRNLSIHRLTFRNSNIEIFSLFSSLNGLQQTLEAINFYDCNVTRWRRSTGTNFSFLKTVYYHKVNLIPILMPEDFENYPNKIERLNINYCKITRMEISALIKFTSLKYLNLAFNRLKSISRNSLPPYLPSLISFSLSNNPLETLPNVMFKQMPRLERLYLGNTKLKTLHQEIFLPVWNKLKIVDFNNVWLNCDCNSTWLLSISWRKRGGYGPSCLGFKKPIQESTYQELCPE